MICLGIPPDYWNNYYYGSFDEIESKNKGNFKWMNDKFSSNKIIISKLYL